MHSVCGFRSGISNRSHNASSYLQAPEADLPPAQLTCAHEDQRLLWDLQACFRMAVQDSVRPASAAQLAALPTYTDTFNHSPRRSGVLTNPRSPTVSIQKRLSTQSRYQQRTAASTVKLAPAAGCNTGLTTWQKHSDHTASQDGRAPGKSMVRARWTAESPEEDLTRQLRMMFCREIKRKQRKTSVLPKVAEVPREGSLQLDPHCDNNLTSHEQDLGTFSFSM